MQGQGSHSYDDEIETSVARLEAYAFNRLRKPLKRHIEYNHFAQQFLAALVEASPLDNVTPAKQIAVNLIVRIIDELEAINLLCSYGYALQAFSIGSVVFELSYTMAGIADNSELAQRWFDHENEDRSFDQIMSLVQLTSRRITDGAATQDTFASVYMNYKLLCLGKHANPKLQAATGFRVDRSTNDRIYECGPNCFADGIQLAWLVINITLRGVRAAFAAYGTYHLVEGKLCDGMAAVVDLDKHEHKLERHERGSLAHFVKEGKGEPKTLGELALKWDGDADGHPKRCYKPVFVQALPILEENLGPLFEIGELTHLLIQLTIRMSKHPKTRETTLAYEANINLLMRMCNELKAILLLCRYGYVIQAISPASVAYELTWTVAAIANNDELAKAWFQHDSYKPFMEIRKLIELGIKNLEGSSPDRDRMNSEYAAYKDMCLFKHANPYIQQTLGHTEDDEGVLHFRNGPDLSSEGIQRARALLLNSIRSTTPALQSFIKTYVPEADRDQANRNVEIVEAKLCEIEDVHKLAVK